MNKITPIDPATTGNLQGPLEAEAASRKAKNQQALPPLPEDKNLYRDVPPLMARTQSTAAKSYDISKMINELSSMKDMAFNYEDMVSVIFKSLLENLRSAGKTRIADAEVQESQRMDAAQQLRDQAADGLAGAICGSSMSVASAGVSLGGAGYIARKGVSNPIEVQNKMQPFVSSGAITQEAGKMVASGTNYQAGLDGATSQEMQAGAEETGAIKESESETYQEIMKLIDQIIQLLQQKNQSDHEAGSRIMPA